MAPSFGLIIFDLFFLGLLGYAFASPNDFIRLFFLISALVFAAMSVFLMILNLQSFSGLFRQDAGVR